jgi:hypothetical protein
MSTSPPPGWPPAEELTLTVIVTDCPEADGFGALVMVVAVEKIGVILTSAVCGVDPFSTVPAICG